MPRLAEVNNQKLHPSTYSHHLGMIIYYSLNPFKMSTNIFKPGQSFGSSQTQAWGSIREHRHEVEKAASRLGAVSMEAQPSPEPTPINSRPSSALERLPDEVLIAIMGYLDHESLYRLSQTTGDFLRLSFDSVFEQDPSWKTFRYTVDQYFHDQDKETELRSGPRRRVLDWARWRARNPVVAQESQSIGHAPAASSKIEPSEQCELVQQSLKSTSATLYTGDEGEGETMLEFMARLGFDG
ncbi:hypothetical protein F4825DRAFT_108542 [Nemania diffusa]|nr:hypothetical protein F4825DRAFT_108542 [Nemania diffusa]